MTTTFDGLSRQQPVQRTARMVRNDAAGEYHHLAFDVPDLADRAEPGQFVAVSVAGDGGQDPAAALLLRRAFSIHRASEGLLELIVSPKGPGTQWLCHQPVGTSISLVGPLGAPFGLPVDRGPVIVVGGGYGAAPLGMFAERARAAGVAAVHAVVGAATAGRLTCVEQLQQLCDSVTVATDDGSAGARGRVTDGLVTLIQTTGAVAVYACGPMPMLQAVAEIADTAGIASRCAVEESMACGIGICMTCVLPVRGSDGRTRMTRSCTDGPVFDGSRVRWSEAGTVPADTVGAPSAPAPVAPKGGSR